MFIFLIAAITLIAILMTFLVLIQAGKGGGLALRHSNRDGTTDAYLVHYLSVRRPDRCQSGIFGKVVREAGLARLLGRYLYL